jgi:ParB family chromosome partitioning protein
MNAILLPIDQVQVGDRKRRLDPERVQALANSMRECGLINPVTVTGSHRLVTGLHRLEAARLLGWPDIAVTIMTGDAIDAELAEIDENLVRQELTYLEKAEHLARREELLRAKGQRRGPGRLPASNPAAAAGLTTSTFASEVGVSERTARELLQIARDIPPDLRAAIRETPIANQRNDLLELARVKDRDAQAAIAQLIASDRCYSVDHARAVLARQRAASEAVTEAANVGATVDRMPRESVPQPTPEPVPAAAPAVAADAPVDPREVRHRAEALFRITRAGARELGGFIEQLAEDGIPLPLVGAALAPDERIALFDGLATIAGAVSHIEEEIAAAERAERNGA